MEDNRRPETNHRVGNALRARRSARRYTAVLSVLAVIITIGVAIALTTSVMAAKHKIRVLDCPVTHAVAHHHDDSCYDDSGRLVCTLPERDLHTHDESCYERQLVCELKEGAGKHYHTEKCYDAEGNLVCGKEEGAGHQHDDSCYADVLVCDKAEVTEEHVHGDGCFRTIAANEDAPEYTHPALTLQHDIYDKDKNLQMRIDVAAPEGALPDGTTLDARMLDADKLDVDLLQGALDEHADKTEGVEAGKALSWQAVRISFQDADGREIEPDGDVTVKLTSETAKTQNARAIVRMDRPEGEARVLKRGEAKSRKDGEPTERVMSQLSDEQLEAQKIRLDEDQVAFSADESNYYVLATTSARHEMGATDGSTVNIDVTAPAEAGIPADAVLDVTRIEPDTDEYDEYVSRSVESMGADQASVGLAQFFDIHIKDADGNELQPAAPVDVKIELADIPAAPNGFAAVHFKESDSEDEESEAATELEQLACGGENGTVTFAAESFSVYGIVYTVDFGHEVNGELYTYTLKGGRSVGLRELAEELHIYEGAPKGYDSVDAFMAEVANVDFSNPNYIWLQQVSGETTLQQLMSEYDLHPQYSADVTEEQKAEWGSASYSDDWVLVSLAPFNTTEMLTITMADGSERIVAITDEGEEIQTRDGESGALRAAPVTVYTPADTRIDLFDYWVADRYQQSDGTWGDGRYMAGKNNDGTDNAWHAWIPQPNPQSVTHNSGDDPSLAGSPNVVGNGYNGLINNGHNFKFHPSQGNTVPDGSYTNNHWSGTNGFNGGGINSYTGGQNPMQGLVEKTLNANGYPTLVDTPGVNGANGEALDYLFDPNISHPGKASYPNVNNLMYVDENTGNYIYDSAAYAATFRPNPNYDASDPNAYSGDFELTQFPSTVPESQASLKGFWPFGDRVYWFGMHVNSKFSQPHDGKVLDAHGQPKNMRFTFTGDDDTWIYVDGVLIGDGGGIHGRTVIDIDFALGTVTVHGTEGAQFGDVEYLDELFVAAGKYTADYDHTAYPTSADDPKYVGNYFNGHAFKPGSKHVFDMFYLERGGSYSNLKVDYNLISTADFEARKVWHGEQSSSPALKRDQFHFELIGLDGLYEYTTVNPNDASDKDYFDITPVAAHQVPASRTDGDYAMAIMPESKSDSNVSSGNTANATVTHPIYNNNVTVDIRNPTPSTAVGQVYATGVMEDGNIVFGTADISFHGSEIHEHRMTNPAYRYIVREIVPDDALSVHGIRWADATDDQRKNDGPFLKDNTLYDGTIYYMVGSVRETFANSGNYIWEKHFYSDDSFTKRVSDDQASPYYDEHFAGLSEFQNSWVPNYIPLTLRVVKRDGENTNKKLSGADFELRKAAEVSAKKWQSGDYVDDGTTANTTIGDGMVDLEFMEPGSYILEETKAPKGYEKPEKKWLIKVRRVDDFSNPARPTDHLEATVTELSLDGTEIGQEKDMVASDEIIEGNEIRVVTQEVDDYPFRFNVEKSWTGVDPDATALANSNIVVTLGRYTVEDVAGTIAITKKGVPEGANVKITYLIDVWDDTAQDWTPVTEVEYAGAWDENGVNITAKPIAVAPGRYRVTERVDEDDDRYGTSHHIQGDTVETWEVDIDDGDTETAEYEAEYTPRLGKISISSTLDNQTNPHIDIPTDNVKYTIYAADDTNNTTPLGTCTFDECSGGTRKEFELLEGNYRMVESGWEDVHGQTYHTNVCTDSTGNPAAWEDLYFSIEQGVTKEYNYRATYESNNAIYVIFYKYDYKSGSDTEFQILYERKIEVGENEITLDERPRRYGPIILDPATDSLRLRFNVGTNDSYPSMRRVGLDYFDNRYDSSITEQQASDGWRTQYTVIIPVSDLGDDRTIYVGNRWGLEDQNGADVVTNITLRERNSSGGTITTHTLSGSNYAHLNPEDVENRSFHAPSQASGNGAGNGTGNGQATRSLSSGDAQATAAGNAGAIDLTTGAQDTGGSKATDSTKTEGSKSATKSTAKSAAKAQATRDAAAKDGGSDDEPMLRAVQPGNYGPTNTIDYGVAPEAPQSGQAHVSEMKYVEDPSFTEDNTVTLTQADLKSGKWQEEVVGLPAVDMEGKRYYYFIKKVEETHMPKNTECTVTLNSDGTQVLSSRTDTSLTGATLSLANDIGNPADIDVYKVDAVSGQKLDGAVFRLLKKVTDPDSGDVSEVVLKSADDITVVKKDGGAAVTVDTSTGDFTVPATGVTIKNVDPGEYVLREIIPPAGYVMSKTDYEFEVSWLGVVDDTPSYITTKPGATADADPTYELNIPNTPGSELPMSGGPGTVLSTIAGVLLAAFGAITLLRNRRAATVEVEEGR